MKIIVAEKISSSAVAQLQEPGWTVLTVDQLGGKLAEHLESADALLVRSAVQVDAGLLAHAKKLRVIGRAGVGWVARVIPDPGKDIGMNILTAFHYPRRLRVVTCKSLVEAARAIGL